MKKPGIGLFLCSFLIILSAKAQLRTAIAGGAHVASVPGNYSPGWDTVNYKYSSRTGFHVGVIADLPFSASSKFYFQPGMFFSNKGRKFSAQYDTSVSTVSSVNALQFINYMEIPVNLLLKLNMGRKSKIMIGGGPYASFLYNGREKKDTYFKNGTITSTENKDLKVATSQGQYNNFDYGFNALFGFEFGRVFLTANYSQGLSDFYKPYSYTGLYKHQVMGGTLGIFLGNKARRASKLKDKDRNPDAEQNNASKLSKPKDRDKDGIPDSEDNCPTDKGDVATNGCPDKDGDGIPDKEDKCPGVKGSSKYNGCPTPDTDKDGVNDDEDKCPLVAGLKKYNGCPVLPVLDTDKDGINDDEDRCPQIAGVKKYGGCPAPDSDNDGVNDDEDRCPNVKGTKANNGCPAINNAIIKKVENAARRIQFNYRRTTLTSKSKIVLDEIVKILKDNPELNVFIEGYTSSDGNPANHKKLSTARAERVRKYFIAKGINPERLKAEGFGAANPLNSGRTEFLRARNRRVELKLTNN